MPILVAPTKLSPSRFRTLIQKKRQVVKTEDSFWDDQPLSYSLPPVWREGSFSLDSTSIIPDPVDP
jgi:hypothetical protein